MGMRCSLLRGYVAMGLLLLPIAVHAVPDAARERAEREAAEQQRAAEIVRRREREAARQRAEQEQAEQRRADERVRRQAQERQAQEAEQRRVEEALAAQRRAEERARQEALERQAQDAERRRVEQELAAQRLAEERARQRAREAERQRLEREATAHAGVNGGNVQTVDFGRDGQHLGSYVQTGPGHWEERPALAGGSAFAFSERHRNDRSVFLYDGSRKVSIQLDLHSRIVYYSDPQSPRRELYQVLSVGRPNEHAQVDTRPRQPAPIVHRFDASTTYRMTTAFRGAGMSLDVHNGGERNDMARLAPSTNYTSQFWRISQRGPDWLELRTASRGDQMCLDVYNGGERHFMPHLAPCANVSGQFWRIVASGDGHYRIQNMFGGQGRCLDIFNGGTYDNGPHLTDCGAYSGQSWRVERVY